MHKSRSQTESVDYEHVIQLKLVESLVNTAQRESDPAASNEILDQLLTFSEAHFIAEQLLMRLHAYPQYEEHTTQHDNLIASCALLQRALDGGDLESLETKARQLKENLLRHIEGSDRLLGAFLHDASAQMGH